MAGVLAMRRIESCPRRWLLTIALLCSALVGCQQSLPRWNGSDAPAPAAAATAENDVSDETPAKTPSPAAKPVKDTYQVSDRVPDAAGNLADRLDKKALPPAVASSSAWVGEAWVLAADDPNAVTEPREHWRHPALEAMLELPRQQQPPWSKYLADKDLATCAQAAIALAKLGDVQSLQPLLAAVREPRLKLSTRRAAAEALGRLPPAAALVSVSNLVEELGRFDGSDAARYVPDIHAELLLTWQKLAPADITDLAHQALASPAPAVRRAALRAYLRRSHEQIPARVLDLLTSDRDAQNRGLVLRVLAAQRDPQTIALAKQALLDADLSVKLAALRALGEYGGDQGAAILRSMQNDPGELIRAAALAGLVKCGDLTALDAALADKSWRVRCALGEALLKDSSERGRKLAAQMLADKSAEVRKTALATLTQWPWPAAGPLLLNAAENEFPAVRQEAIHQLRSRWSAARELTASTSLERLKVQCAELREQLNEELVRLQGSAAPVKLAAWEEFITDEVAESKDKLTQQTRRLLKQQDQAWRSCVIRFKQKQAPERRAALQEFHKALDGCACEKAIWQELQVLLEQEHDTTVWLAALAMFAAQHEPHLAPLLALGTSHPSAEVRKQALEWFIENPNPAYGDLLTNSLLDDHVAVIQAALRALAALDELPNPRAIEELLAARDPAIRLAAAYVLAAHGIPPGYAALIRLAYHEEPQIRRQVAVLLGELGDIRSIHELIRLLDDRPEVQLACLASLQALLGQDVSLDPALQALAGISTAQKVSGKTTLTSTEQCRCWKTWHQRDQAKAPRTMVH
jgi:HEAT repeat protein